jgi:hypothetical protein
MNWLKIENREFNGKKWEGRGWESKKIFFVWLKLKIEAKIICYPFTQICIISHKGTIFSQNKNSVSERIFIFRYKNVASKSFYQNKIHPFPLMLMQRNEMWYTYTPLAI